MMDFVKYIITFLISVISALVLVPICKRFAPKMGLVDEPSERRIHKQPIPRCGGIAVFIATQLALLFAFWGPWRNVSGAVQIRDWFFLLVGSSVLLVIGIIDDRKDIRAWVKLGGQIAVAVFMYFMGFSFGRFLHFDLWFIVDLGLTVFWFLLFINALNLIDGMDGACAGMGTVAAAAMATVLLFLHQPMDALVLIALMGACLGFLRYNFHPASIFLGDAGSMFIGFMLAAISLKANLKQSTVVIMLIPLLTIGIPVFDVILAIWRRLFRKLVSLLRKEGSDVKVFGPDLDHIHHKLLRSGMTQRKAAIALYIGALVVCLISLSFVMLSSNRLGIGLVGLGLLVFVLVRNLAHIELWTTAEALLLGLRRPRSVLRLIAFLFWDIAALSVATWFVYKIIFGQVMSIRILFVGIFVPMIVLYFLGGYASVWARSRALERFLLLLSLLAGELVAFVGLIFLNYMHRSDLIVAAVVHYCFAALVIVMARMIWSVLHDFVSWTKASQPVASGCRAFLVGSEEQLEHGLQQIHNALHEEIQVVGLVSSEAHLIGKKLNGYEVLGSCDQLESLLSEHKISDVILGGELHASLKTPLLGLARKHGFRLRQVYVAIHDLCHAGKHKVPLDVPHCEKGDTEPS